MKVHYINILLFALLLNILEHNQRNHNSIPQHVPTTRLLCECELYKPNYDSDPQMKEVMQQFEDRTSQRFHEYDERMKTTRQKCKNTCDKEIQKIILKDKLEKELLDKFATLQTDIQNDAIPTCICEKSLSDKMEKFCLNCGVNVGGGVTLSSGVLGGIAQGAIGVWKNAAIAAATKYAMKEGLAFGKFVGEAAGKKAVIEALKQHFFTEILGIKSLDPYFTEGYCFKVEKLAEALFNGRNVVCNTSGRSSLVNVTCEEIGKGIGTLEPNGGPAAPGTGPVIKKLSGLLEQADQAAAHVTETTTKDATAAAIETSKKAIDAASTELYPGIGYSILAILIIVLIMVVIYLILRYRRKKKMKKKLQYIKILEE